MVKFLREDNLEWDAVFKVLYMRNSFYILAICAMAVSCEVLPSDGRVAKSDTVCSYSEVRFAESVILPVEVMELCLDLDRYLAMTDDEKSGNRLNGSVKFLGDDTYEVSGKYDGDVRLTVSTGGLPLYERGNEWEIRKVSLNSTAYNSQFLSTYMLNISTGGKVWLEDTEKSEWMVSFPELFDVQLTLQDRQGELYGWNVVLDREDTSSVGVTADIRSGDGGISVREVWTEEHVSKQNVYEGEFLVDIYDNGEPMDYCSMTFSPGFTTTYRASR